MKKTLLIITGALLLLSCNNSSEKKGCDEATAKKIADNYDYVIGTQTMAARYHFTDKSALVETAEGIMEMGSNVIKFSINPLAADPELQEYKYWTPLKLATDCPTIKTVLDMPFKYTILWATSPGVNWYDGMAENEKVTEYYTMLDFAKYLLKQYKGTGRVFYLGHWEGDWLLLGHTDNTQEKIDPVRINGMIDWYKIRQKAIDDARAAVQSDVKVYNYAEVNRVTPALYKGYDRMVNKVLPNINVDYVSYSSYESIVEEVSGANYSELKDYLFKSLDYIEKNMKPKASITGKRVFIGEFGYPLRVVRTPTEQLKRTLNTLRASIEWGCPFALYWEFYDNEGDTEGYWMINSKNEKQPVYNKYAAYYKEMHEYVYQYALENGSAPSDEDFREKACSLLSSVK